MLLGPKENNLQTNAVTEGLIILYSVKDLSGANKRVEIMAHRVLVVQQRVEVSHGEFGGCLIVSDSPEVIIFEN